MTELIIDLNKITTSKPNYFIELQNYKVKYYILLIKLILISYLHINVI